MDPNLFVADWEKIFEALMFIIVSSFIVERFLALLFESRFWIEKVESKGSSLKEVLALIVSVTICVYWSFDAVSMIIPSQPTTTLLGEIVTGGVIAGGSKASVKLFHDLLKIQSSARAAKKKGDQPTNESQS